MGFEYLISVCYLITLLVAAVESVIEKNAFVFANGLVFGAI